MDIHSYIDNIVYPSAIKFTVSLRMFDEVIIVCSTRTAKLVVAMHHKILIRCVGCMLCGSVV